MHPFLLTTLQNNSVIQFDSFSVMFTLPSIGDLQNYYFMFNYDSVYYNVTEDLFRNINQSARGNITISGSAAGEHIFFIDMHDMKSGAKVESSDTIVITKKEQEQK